MVRMVQFLLLAGLIQSVYSAATISLSSPTVAYFTITATVTIDGSDCSSGTLDLTNSGGTIYGISSLSQSVSSTTSFTFTFYYKAAASGSVIVTCSDFTSITASQSITVTEGTLTFSGSDTYPSSSSTSFSVTVTLESGGSSADLSSTDSVTLSLSPGGKISGTISGTLSSGAITFSGLQVLTKGTFYLVASANGMKTGVSSSSFTVTNSLVSIKVTPSVYTVAASSTFDVKVDLIGDDGNFYEPSTSISLTEDSGTSISGASSTSVTKTYTFSSLQFSSNGVKVIKATDGTVTGYSSVTVTSGNSVTLTYTGDLIINHQITVRSMYYDNSLNLITSSASGTLSGNIAGTTTGSSSTGIISYTMYFTASGSQTLSVLHGTASTSITLTIDKNTAVITPAKVWAQEPDTLTYTVYLKYSTAISEVISITNSDSNQFTLSVSSLSFTSANTAQTVTVTVKETTLVGSTTKTISHSSSNVDFTSPATAISSGVFTVTIYDATDTYVVMSSTPTLKEGGSTSTTFYLSKAPSSDVTLTFSTHSSLTLSTTTLTFTSSNYGTAQSMTVTSSVSSVNEAGSNVYSLTFSSSSSDKSWTSPSSLPSSFKIYVIKLSNPQVLISESVVFQESQGGSYSIVLTSEPTSSVTVTLSSTGSTIKFSPSVLTFDSTNYDVPQSVSLYSVQSSTPRYLKYSITISHSVSSSDANYNSITPVPSSSIKVTAVHPCKAGLYAWPPGSGTCELCPLGYECPTLYEEKTACTTGYYSPLGVWNCLPCPPDHSCSGSTMPKPCADGYTSAEGVGVCSSCSGVPCDKAGGSISSAPAGFYLMNKGHSMYICPPGYSCSGGSSLPSACSSGYYAPLGSSSCTQCPKGFYCPDPATPIPIPCDPYSYSSAGALYCNYCPVGYSCTGSGSTACTSSQYSLEGWMECVTIDIMTYGGGTTGCGLGYYYLASTSTCTICPVGYQCDGMFRKACPPGWYASSTGSSACTQCSLGYYAVSVEGTSCTQVTTAGKYSNLVNNGAKTCHRGLTSVSPFISCTSCTAGYQCDDPATPTTCAAGSVCFPIGVTQNSGSNQQPCPSGYYYGSTGGDEFSDCIACTAGYYCPKKTSTPVACPKGHYCPAYSYVPDNFPCPVGYKENSGTQDQVSDCVACTAGYYCYQGASVELQCPRGYYCEANSYYPKWCSPGYTSPANSDDSSDCTICAAGSFCPPGSFKMPCPPGTFNTNTGGGFMWDACSTCTAGYSCTNYGQTVGTTNACSAGHYCPAGTEHAEQFPCPAGTFSDATNAVSVSGCGSCTQGYYCQLGSTTGDIIKCPRGHYCPTSTAFSHNNPCDAGSYSWSTGNTDSSNCAACTAGRYCARGAAYISGYCSPGYVCPTSSITPDLETNACAAGKFMAYYNATASSECQDCPPGFFCVKGSGHPVPCPPGYYSSSSGSSSCTQCSANKYCPAGSSSETVCADGYYSLAGSYVCEKCPGGYYCASGSKTSCSAGTYCPEGSSSETVCPAGYYCAATSSEATPCPAGKIQGSTGKSLSSDCTNVAAGSYSILGSASATGKCEPGYYCDAGSAGPYNTPCPAGKYVHDYGATSSSSCLDCPAGYYCKLGTADPVICPVGYYCASGVSLPTFCPAGKIGLSEGLKASTDCSSCPQGSYCTQPGLLVADGTCAPGFVCAAGSTLSSGGGSTCQAGGYCQPGFITQRKCPPGTYNPNQGAKDVTGCGDCEAGYYCYGDETVANQNECTAGYYCPIGSYWSKMKISYPGYYSEAAQSEPTVCPIGTYNRLYAQSACTTCREGFYCPSKQMIEPTICPVGYYCVAGVDIYSSCPAGTFNPRLGLTTQDDCNYCTPGKYCLKAGLSAVTGQCDPGYYCTFGGKSKKPDTYDDTDGNYGQCPTGHYCEQGSPLPVACPSGTYNPDEISSGVSECVPCDAGKYCKNTGLDSVEGDCDPGYYCLSGDVFGTKVPRPTEGTEINYCKKGFYCPSGSSEPTSVPVGHYQDELRKHDYKTCPAGYYCVTETGYFESFLCPAGYYCPEGTESKFQYPCPQGTYSPREGLRSEGECIDCPPGYFCGTTGKSSIDTTNDKCSEGYFCKKGSKLQEPIADYPGDSNGGRCVKGYYCPAGSAYALKCDGGKYCGDDKLSAVSGDCDAGYYCIGGATTKTPSDGTTGNKCPKGHYCPAGSQSPIPCRKGTYNSLFSKEDSGACLSCTAKYYCGSVGLSKVTGLCAEGFYCSGGNYELMPKDSKCTAGHYCPEGSSAERNCPVGYYQDRTLQKECKECPEGYYCDTEETVTPTQCETGYYCPKGSTDHQPCPAGTFTNVLGRWKVSQCMDCPPGKYCSEAASTPTGDCSEGYYCLGATTKDKPTEDAEGGICPKGYYCPTGSTSAIKCTPGKYCETKGLSAPTGDCLEGYYCMEGAISKKPTDKITGAICPAGYYCPTGSTYPIPCEIGKYQPSQGKSDSSHCLTCQAGYYCARKAAKTFSGVCGGGYFCPSGSTIQKNPSNKCPQGTYCEAGSSTSKDCPEGTFQNLEAQSSCQECPAGFYCDVKTITPTICPVGYKCPAGTSDSSKQPCSSGYYNPFEGQSDCLPCPRGYYCLYNSAGITDPVECPARAYCPEGTKTSTNYCPAGTYTEKTGLQSKDQCMPCPSGYYCDEGEIKDQCLAGYFCRSGCNKEDPDSYTNTGSGSPCPEGHYCLLGTIIPIPCPEGKFRKEKGGKTVDDCKYCEAGYYCIPNDPVPKPCPTGAYCPEGSSTPLLCKEGYYSTATMASSESVCTICPSGYICDRAGIGNYKDFPCTPGYYCPSGAQLPVKAPEKYYSPGASAGSIPDLNVCPEGFYCEEMSTGYAMCSIGNYCKTGVSVPTPCGEGYFCDYQSSEPTPCPIGFYCQEYEYPMDDYPPLLCPFGTICPVTSVSSTPTIGSIVPIYCSAGKYAIMAKTINSDESTECGTCPPGMYSLTGWIECLYCDPGYICLEGASVPNPDDRDIYNGYKCGKGYYCPSGITEPIPCPMGTFSLNETLGSLNDCEKCPVNTYSDKVASINCTDCSSSSSSVEGSTNCKCKGNKRLYLKEFKRCVCQVGFEYIDSSGNDQSDKDGTDDCLEIVYDRCEEGQVRDELGDCRSKNDCDDFCNGKGARDVSTGTCQCEDVTDLSSICGVECRDQSTKYSLGPDGSIIETKSDGTSTSKKISEIPNFAGSIDCGSSSCQIVSMNFDNKFNGEYGYSNVLKFDEKSRKLKDTNETNSVENPVVCISEGDTMVFSVTSDNFPVYLKDSLLNSNKKFDYSKFTQLKNDIEDGGVSYSSFGFTFKEAGIYIFADNKDRDQQIIVGVMRSDQQCPFGSAFIQPRMTSSLHLLGVKLDDNIVLTVDWIVVYGIMGFLVFTILVFTGFFYYYSKLVWSQPGLKHVEYRDENQILDIKDDVGPRNTKKVIIEGKEAESSGSEAEEIQDMLNEKVPESADYELPSEKEEKNLIDAALMQAIKDKIRDNNGMFRRFMEDNDAETADRLNRLEEEAEDLKNLMESLLNPIRPMYHKPATAASGVSVDYHHDLRTGASSEVDYQEALNDIAVNEDLLEQDKQKLMNELNSELSKLDHNLKLEKSKHDSELSKKLADRAQKRRELERKKQELESDEKLTQKRHQNEKKQINIELENAEVQLDNEINEDKFDMARQLHGQKAIELQNKLREGVAINPEKQQELFRQYELEIQSLEKNLTMNQIRQQQDLARRIEEKKRNRKAKIAEDKAKTTADLEAKHKVEVFNLNQRRLEIEAQEVVASVMPVLVEKNDDLALRELEEKQKKEIVEAEKALKEQEEQEVAKMMRNSSITESKIAQQKAQLEKQKKELVASLDSATEEEREELMNDLRKTEQRLKEINDEQSLEQKKNLDTRLDMRRKKREEKIREIKEKQEKEREKAEKDAREKVKADRAASLEAAIKEAMGRLPEDQKAKAIQAMLEEKHENEQIELNKKLKKKVRNRQKRTIQEVMNMKIKDLELLRNEYKEKIKAAGRDAETTARIQKEENEALSKLDYFYMKKLEKMQEDDWKDQQKKNQDELLALIDSQLAEMRKHLHKKDPNTLELEARLKKEREEIEKEGKERLEFLEKQKKELEEQRALKQREIEDMIRKDKEREEKERMKKEIQDKKRAILERQRKEKEELMRRGLMTKEQMDKLIADHQKELNALEMAIARERDRQIGIMSQKIAEKQARKREYESSMQRMKEEQDRLQKELEELPGITNKQATTLLLKWRRYPKKNIRDIEKSVKNNDPAQKLVPIVNKHTQKQGKKVENKRLEELIWRIEKIENTVDHVSDEHVNNIFRSIKTIEDRVRTLKK